MGITEDDIAVEATTNLEDNTDNSHIAVVKDTSKDRGNKRKVGRPLKQKSRVSTRK